MSNFIDQLLSEAQTSNFRPAAAPAKAGSSKLSLSLVYGNNGKRLEVSKALADKLQIQDGFYLTFLPDSRCLLISASYKFFKSCPYYFPAGSQGQSRTLYNADLVYSLLTELGYDYTGISSHSFSDIAIEKAEFNGEEVPIAYAKFPSVEDFNSAKAIQLKKSAQKNRAAASSPEIN